jgi:hypothetical protein
MKERVRGFVCEGRPKLALVGHAPEVGDLPWTHCVRQALHGLGHRVAEGHALQLDKPFPALAHEDDALPPEQVAVFR